MKVSKKECSIDSCNNLNSSKGLCQKHARALNLYGDALHCDKIKERQKFIREHSANKTYYAIHWRVSPNNKQCKKNYYDRGITVCDRWKGENNGLENFINDMGEKPTSEHSLDRIDNDKSYSPDNCRWANNKVQARNQQNTVKVIFNGEEICLRDFCENKKYNFNLIYRRILRGMTLEEAIIARKHRHYHEIEINGIKGTLLHWSKVYGFAPTSASKQLKKGRSIESIIEGSKKRREAIDRCKNKKTIKKN